MAACAYSSEPHQSAKLAGPQFTGKPACAAYYFTTTVAACRGYRISDFEWDIAWPHPAEPPPVEVSTQDRGAPQPLQYVIARSQAGIVYPALVIKRARLQLERDPAGDWQFKELVYPTSRDDILTVLDGATASEAFTPDILEQLGFPSPGGEAAVIDGEAAGGDIPQDIDQLKTGAMQNP
eukprot:GHVR01102778.1.p4 GENE.GHVR01102778.1~~GHVR01102778.1.p4  ORF type:complete len:180 (+),score=36.34 GHVR01102778.1:2435-2974(+)